jgi:hypothetical protein
MGISMDIPVITWSRKSLSILFDGQEWGIPRPIGQQDSTCQEPHRDGSWKPGCNALPFLALRSCKVKRMAGNDRNMTYHDLPMVGISITGSRNRVQTRSLKGLSMLFSAGRLSCIFLVPFSESRFCYFPPSRNPWPSIENPETSIYPLVIAGQTKHLHGW